MNPWKYIETQASILQLENYSALRWWSWWIKHPFTIATSTRKKVVWTKRLIATMVLSPWIMSGVNYIYEQKLRNEIKKTLAAHMLKKIAITGSYGKTSVKGFLYTILDTCGYALTTPGSFNTLGGITRVLRKELTHKHEYFVVELGAYHRGDIQSLAELINPDLGIITAIGPQHLERFGSLDTIKQTKFELFDQSKKCIVNWDDKEIRDYVTKNHLENKVIPYSCDFTFDQNGLQVRIDGASYTIPRLFGTVMAQNVGLAIKAALELGLTPKQIQFALQFIYPPEHRLELSALNKATIIDDTYSSNVKGFEQMIEDLKQLPGKKALVTPGIVELGNEEVHVHRELASKLKPVFDIVIGVGKTVRTAALEADAVIPLDTTIYWQTVNELSKTYDWIVLENDIAEQYL